MASEYQKEYYRKNREHILQSAKEYYQKHKEERILYSRNYKRKHWLHQQVGDNSFIIRGLNKTPYPKDRLCFICSKPKKLTYHHKDKEFNNGIWICIACHRALHLIARNWQIAKRYLPLDPYLNNS